MCVISPCIHSEIFWSTYLLSDVYVCSIALYFYELCRIFTSTRGAFRANSNIFQFFRESKLAKFLRCQNFGGSLIKPVNFEQNFTDWLIRQSKTFSRYKKKKKISRELLCKNGSFFPEDLLCFGWRLRYSCWLRYLQRKANLLLKPYVLHIAASVTVPRVRATDIWIKAELKIVSLERKRVRWMRKILPLHAVLDQRTTEFIFTMQLYPNISCTTWHLDGWKKIIACFGKIWKPPKQVSGSFEVWQKSRDSTLIVDRVFS